MSARTRWSTCATGDLLAEIKAGEGADDFDPSAAPPASRPSAKERRSACRKKAKRIKTERKRAKSMKR